MVTAVDTLPTELIDEIMALLSRPALAQMALANQMLHRMAIWRIYSDINLDKRTGAGQVARLLTTLFTRPVLARLVIRLKLDWDIRDLDLTDSSLFLSTRPAECVSLRRLYITGPSALVHIDTMLRLIEQSPIEILAYMDPSRAVEPDPPLQSSFSTIRRIDSVSWPTLQAIAQFRLAVSGANLNVSTLVLRRRRVEKFPNDDVFVTLDCAKQIPSIRTVMLLDTSICSELGYDVGPVAQVSRIVLADCMITSRTLSNTRTRSLTWLMHNTATSFPNVVELELVCKSGQKGIIADDDGDEIGFESNFEETCDHSNLKKENEKARVLAQMQQLMLGKAPRSLRKITVCRELIIFRTSATSSFHY